LEKTEDQIFGEKGFEKIFDIVKHLEKKIGISDISKESNKIERFLKMKQ
jgi:hypothetical protein